jgi:hypothetical protein
MPALAEAGPLAPLDVEGAWLAAAGWLELAEGDVAEPPQLATINAMIAGMTARFGLRRIIWPVSSWRNSLPRPD